MKVACIIICLIVPIVLLILFLWDWNSLYKPQSSDQILIPNKVIHNVKSKNEMDLKYILQWTSPNSVPFVYMGKGQSGFIERKCPYTNCIVTANRSYFDDYSKFDVIAFAGPEVFYLDSLPNTRSPHQKYVFASIESSDNYPVCSNRFDRYFNWTWTYKLDSEVLWGYFAIRDKNNTLIGPNKQMHWLKLQDMDPVSEHLKMQLRTKTKAAASFLSNCDTRSEREKLVKEIKEELQKYSMVIDIYYYGNCENFQCSRDNEECEAILKFNMDTDTYGNIGNLQCSRDDEDCDDDECSRDIISDCDAILKEKYYFYLAFENSCSEDYVTEKLFQALNNNAVPIVYGGANYTRYMPDGIYLNAGELKVGELAAKMHELINDSEKYSEYFKWKNHYSYHRQHKSVAETEPYCLFCAHLNDKEMVNQVTVYEDFRNWWDPPGRCGI